MMVLGIDAHENAAAEDRRIAMEAAIPVGPADNHDVAIVGSEEAAERGGEAKELEVITEDVFLNQGFGVGAGDSDLREVVERHPRDGGEALRMIAEVEVGRPAPIALPVRFAGEVLEELHELLGMATGRVRSMMV